MENEKTRIEMEFVNDGEQEEEAKELAEVKKTEEKPGFLATIWNGITFVPRWIGKKVSESPASAAIGMVGGAALGWGAKAMTDHFAKKGQDGFIPAEPIEIPDDGEVYSTNTNTYESNTDE